MTSKPANTTATIVPTMRYRNALAAIDWLCNAFGFEKRMVVADESGTVHHAELTFGNGMMMLGSVTDSEFGRFVAQPDQVGDRETQAAYVIVADADAVYASAKALGAEIISDIKNEDYGGRGFGCRDIEGHIWYLGTYDPWKA